MPATRTSAFFARRVGQLLRSTFRSRPAQRVVVGDADQLRLGGEAASGPRGLAAGGTAGLGCCRISNAVLC